MSMRIIGAVLVLAFARMVSLGQSLTVNFNGGAGTGGPNVVEKDGVTAVANGNDVEIGYFTAGFDFEANKNNAPALAAAYFGGTWQAFGTTAINGAGLAGPGGFTGATTRNNTTSVPTAASFQGQQIDLWVFQTSDNKAPAAGFSNVVGYGLFTGPVTANPSHTWAFPAANTPPTVDNINTSDITSATVLYGSLLAASGANPAGSLEVAAVPEPGTLALLGLGLGLGVVVRRVRRN
jgi:hypothetical protein